MCFFNHGSKEFSRKNIHVNTAKSFNPILRRSKHGVFHYLNKRHLQRYIDEGAFGLNDRDHFE
ncbi:MAG: transposase, partial [Bacteroidales bacterium]|nr:transposase [Bacteroidales bacterium]